MALLWLTAVILYSLGLSYPVSGYDTYSNSFANPMIVVRLTWNYTNFNPYCVSPIFRYHRCLDVRVCDYARASLKMGGRPAICDWVNKDVPKVCCGFPLVLGERLMKTIQSEKARTRECGTISDNAGVSPTENRFFEILNSLPPLDIDVTVPPSDGFGEGGAVGGSDAMEGKYPWMVAIFRGLAFWCGGSLIDRKHILSAAHCFLNSGEEPNPAMYTVRLGSIELNKAVRFNVSKIKVHENYDERTHYNDIAILTLAEEILVPDVAHVCLPDAHLAARDLTGLKTTLLGWGDLAYGEVNSPILQEVEDIPVVSNDQCDRVYQPITRSTLPRGLTQDFICAGLDEGGKDACQRDSGGPLLYKNNVNNLPSYDYNIPWVLVGIVSFGDDCGKPGYPGVYTRVSTYMEWIVKNSAE